MANENDTKIKTLLKAIEDKKEKLGSKPKAAWKTNGVVKTETVTTNINTINSISVCIELASSLMQKKLATKSACEFLGIEYKEDDAVSDSLSDLKLRCQIINWDLEKKKLQEMESKLKDLRSLDAKTEDSLSEIANLLK
jgi:hypothetical protein